MVLLPDIGGIQQQILNDVKKNFLSMMCVITKVDGEDMFSQMWILNKERGAWFATGSLWSSSYVEQVWVIMMHLLHKILLFILLYCNQVLGENASILGAAN